ncbi:hypothetical protein [Cylindrospermum sp. FACHB-282]|uniref:hypothetical protein n=1 Tax=Cylindrospermum sp. FACHB-282 TaxID=2692794 RepID=UPI0016897F23|nr:hypothetical protein [Cylindrospermum sp. FACHB-282]
MNILIKNRFFINKLQNALLVISIGFSSLISHSTAFAGWVCDDGDLSNCWYEEEVVIPPTTPTRKNIGSYYLYYCVKHVSTGEPLYSKDNSNVFLIWLFDINNARDPVTGKAVIHEFSLSNRTIRSGVYYYAATYLGYFYEGYTNGIYGKEGQHRSQLSHSCPPFYLLESEKEECTNIDFTNPNDMLCEHNASGGNMTINGKRREY